MKTVAWISCMCTLLVVGGIGCMGYDVVISEVAWAGTAASSADEWMELHNQGETDVDLSGWHLAFGDTRIPLFEVGDDTLEVRGSVLPAGGFILLERTDDSSVSDIAADILYKGGLSNSGVVIELSDGEGAIVDSVSLVEPAGWAAGGAADAVPPYCTMERSPSGDWGSNIGLVVNGLDADGNPLNGTPRQPNSVTVLAQRAPAVSLIFPAEQGASLSGTELVLWAASDPDDEDSSLSITLLVSANEGIDWIVLVEGLTNAGSYSWDTSTHPSGDKVQLMVRATDMDGYVTEAVSPLFSLSNGGT